MTEYELHTQGACHCLAPAYDGRDPMRNRPHSNGTDTTMTIQRYDLGREYAGNTGSPAITEQADGGYVSHADHLALINEMQAELVGVERIAAAQTVTIAELRAAPVADCWSNNDGDSWSEHPADGDFVDGLKVGDEYELQASVSSWPERFRVIKAPDDTSDDYEVEPVSICTAQQLPVSAPIGMPDVLANVSTVLANGDGFWASCTGCHELNEGHSTGRWSEALQCHLGLGCSECGGIGAIWDTTDYQAMADDMAATMGQNVSAPTPPANKEQS